MTIQPHAPDADPVATYQQAWRELAEAREILDEMARLLRNASESLAWFIEDSVKLARLTDTDYFEKTGPEDRQDWPAFGEITEAVEAWESAFEVLCEAWQAVPLDRRDGLKSPEDLVEG